jgi:hypothetical protein
MTAATVTRAIFQAWGKGYAICAKLARSHTHPFLDIVAVAAYPR